MNDAPIRPAAREAGAVLPHDYPFLFIDEVNEIVPGVRVVCTKNVSINEWFFQGHYPGHPVMPGMLVVEAMAQAGGILLLSDWHGRTAVAYFSSMDKAKFRRAIRPGDVLRLEATLQRSRSSMYWFRGETFVGDQLAAEAEFAVAIVKTT
ncbi:MAG: 3-hydroxyacyl-ACP dehydratase FabZ [bacterium]